METMILEGLRDQFIPDLYMSQSLDWYKVEESRRVWLLVPSVVSSVM